MLLEDIVSINDIVVKGTARKVDTQNDISKGRQHVVKMEVNFFIFFYLIAEINKYLRMQR